MPIVSRRWTLTVCLLAASGCSDLHEPPMGMDPDAGGGAGVDGGPGPGAPDGGLGEPGWPPPPPPPPIPDAFAPVYLVTDANQLLLVSAEAPDAVLSARSLGGLAGGEKLVGIDFRPATGELYGLASSGQLYVIDLVSAAATPIGTPIAPALIGTSFGFDFNPTVDRIRVVSDAGENLRLHPVTGAVAGTDTPLAYDSLDGAAGTTPRVTGSAYTASFLGSTRTTLFGIDTDRDSLVRQGSDGGGPISPNSGTLFTVGTLGVDVSAVVGFDIASRDAAFAALVPAGQTTSQLHIINLATGAATPIAGIGGGVAISGVAVPTPASPMVYALTETNKLIGFRANQPDSIVGWVPITGLADGEQALAIDFRPATGELYALGSGGRIYTVEIETGAATQIGTAPISPPPSGTSFGFDFNPTVDRIRLVSDTRQNLRLHPVTGAVAGVDVGLSYPIGDAGAGSPPKVAASAYTASFLGSTRTTLFGIDTGKDTLVRQGSVGGTPNSPNFGTLFTIGALGLDIAEVAGFDIADRDAAFAALLPAGEAATGFYIVNLATGAATSLGAIGGGEKVTGIALPPPAPPTFYAATDDNMLVSFRADAPGAALDAVAIAGLAGGERLVGLDVRPATGQLYGLGSAGQLYRIDTETGATTPIGAPIAPSPASTSFGFDFNPTVDRIRVIGDAGDNLRLHPVTGAVAGIDTPLAYDAADPGAGVPPRAIGAAYTASFLGSTRTTLYDIDAERDALVRQGSEGGSPTSPNLGTLFTVGALGIDADQMLGIDIASTGAAFAVLVPAGSSAAQLHVVNLATGALTALGPVSGSVVAAAIAP